MGLFKALGSIAGSFFGGPTGSAIGGAIGTAIDGKESAQQAGDLSLQEYTRQKEFAQMGIRWKAEDAKAAGLHPLAVIGSAGSSYSPTVVLPDRPDYSATESALASMGQNTTRAQVATQTVTERRLEELAIRNAELRNSALELELAARTASLLGQPSNPPAPSAVGITPVQAGSTLAHRSGVSFKPSESVAAAQSNLGLEAGSSPFSKRHNLGGRLGVRLPSQQAAEALEGLGAAQHFAGPALLGLSAARELMYGPDNKPDPRMKWNPLRQSWEFDPSKGRGKSYRPSSSFGLWR